MKYKENDHIVCESCGNTFEDPVQDYVVAGKVGVNSICSDMCGYCDWAFNVERVSDGVYDVEPEC